MSAKRKTSKNTSSPSNSAKKRKTQTQCQLAAFQYTETQDSVPSPAASDVEVTSGINHYVFKDPEYSVKNTPQMSGRRGKTWKNLKQIVQTERSLPWKTEDPLYSNIDAPPSFRPAKKYSDLSGLPSKYTDPTSKLRYATADEYSRATLLPSDIVTGLLQLRKANALVP